MKELLIILVSSAIVHNVVLSQFLGLCPFFGVSKKTETAVGMGGAPDRRHARRAAAAGGRPDWRG